MNTTNIPGFTAENSTYRTISQFQSAAARTLDSGKGDNHVYLQLANQYTEGGACHATTSGGTVNVGTYNKDGDWC